MERTGWLFKATAYSSPNDFNNRWLGTTTPSALTEERGHFSLWRSHPPSRRIGIRLSQPFWQFGQLCSRGGHDHLWFETDTRGHKARGYESTPRSIASRR